MKKNAVCNTCTLKLVSIAYQRFPFFRLMREPLKLAMRIFARCYHVTPDDYEVRTPVCYGCIRFYKTALKERSGLFRRLNRLINPVFDFVLERIVTEDEVKSAETYAQLATNGEIELEDSLAWVKGQNIGFSSAKIPLPDLLSVV